MAALLALLAATLLGGPVTAAAGSSLAFSHVYGDGMVLQMAPHAASVWGWAAPGAKVTVSVVDDEADEVLGEASAQARADGAWRVSLPAQPASTKPVSVVAKDGTSTVTLADILFGDVYVCSGQSNMAFSVAVPTNDEGAEAKIAAAYASDPGASPSGKYVSTDAAIKDAVNHPNLRFLVIGNKHDCPEPITDYYPSPGTNNSKLALAHPWQKPNATTIGVGKDVMGGNNAGEMSATCYYFGLELHTTQKIPIGLIHSSYGGSAVEDWISKETLGDGSSGPCPGKITSSMGVPSQQWNGQLVPLLNTTIKGTIWYQGESNHGQNELYTCRYEQLMTEWREQWHLGTGGATDPNMPMGFVQIGPMTNDEGDNADSFLIRMGQTAGFGYAPNKRWPNAFMSTGFDLMNPPGTKCVAGCIHIFNKQAVAHRLALAARQMIYGEKVVFSGPRIVSAALDLSALSSSSSASGGSTLTVKYDSIGTEGEGIKLRCATLVSRASVCLRRLSLMETDHSICADRQALDEREEHSNKTNWCRSVSQRRVRFRGVLNSDGRNGCERNASSAQFIYINDHFTRQARDKPRESTEQKSRFCREARHVDARQRHCVDEG